MKLGKKSISNTNIRKLDIVYNRTQQLPKDYMCKSLVKKEKDLKSYFFKISFYFTMTFLIPAFIIICLNIRSQTIVKEKILQINRNSSEQIFQLLDVVAKEMEEICVKLALSDQLKDYAKVATEHTTSKTAYRRLELSEFLQNYYREKCGDIFCYFPKDNYIVSGVKSNLNYVDYYNTYYKKMGVSFTDFERCLTDNIKVPSFYSMAGDDETFLGIFMHTDYYTIGVMLDSDYLKELLGNTGDHGGSILIFDKNRELVLASDQRQNYDLEDYKGDSEPYETSFDFENYTMWVYKANFMNSYYAYVVPEEYFQEQFFEMRIMSVGGILLCFFIGILAVLIFSKKAYKPVNEVVDLLQEKKKYNPLGQSEFEFMKDCFIEVNEEKYELFREKRKNGLSIRNHYIMKILVGGSFEENDMPEKAGLEFYSNLFVAGIIILDRTDATVDFALRNVFEDIFNRHDKGYVLQLTANEHAFLLNLSDGLSEKQIEELLLEGKQFLEANFCSRMTIGYSSVHEGAQEVQRAYKEAQRAVSYRYVLGKEKIISFMSVESRRFTYLNSKQEQIGITFTDYLERASYMESPVKFVKDIFKAYDINEGSSLETVQCFRFDVVNGINMICIKYGMDENSCKKNLDKLFAVETIWELEDVMIQILTLIRQKRQEEKKNNRIFNMTKQYIDENYANQQLSLSLISEVMNISVSYLTKLYKENYDMSVAQEIARVRLDRAKQLLRESELNMRDIAEQTGFSNDNVFIRAFKKWEGITPGKYREIYRSDKVSKTNM